MLAGLAALPREQVGDLLTLADDVRRRASGDDAAVEVLFNAKKGGCSEDCHFCSQSARYATDVVAEPLREAHEFLDAAREARDRGAGEFCIVVAVRGPSRAIVDRVCDATRAIVADMPDMHVAVSLGILTDAHCEALLARRRAQSQPQSRDVAAALPGDLLDALVRRTLGNVPAREASRLRTVQRRHHRHGRRRRTTGSTFCARCKNSDRSRCRSTFSTRGPERRSPTARSSIAVEALRFVAMARLALPHAVVRLAGGREITLQGMQDLGMRSGASGIVLGSVPDDGRP